MNTIDPKQKIGALRPKLLYDGDCCFCTTSVKLLQAMDWLGKIEYAPTHKGISEMRLDFPQGKSYGGFFAFRQLVWMIPLLYVLIPIVYFPGSGMVGPYVYRWVARNRHVLPIFRPNKKGYCPR